MARATQLPATRSEAPLKAHPCCSWQVEVLDLLTCQDGASVGDTKYDVCAPTTHEYSQQLRLFIGVYVVGTAFIVNFLRMAFNTWVRSQKGMAKQLSQAFFGRKGDKTRQRLSQVPCHPL